ncbi:winged helix-turn-helix transcriptional regulator [uncultured Hymenobacter sp.]|uniref:winged helix-turn-helix transcriptional regulator n=1 Tax=uncultured Hymenobacter sp. TaxID=170016 RepID=UPI0035CA66BB
MMHERKIPLDLACGVHLAREVLAGKWKVALLFYLSQGICRPGQLQKKMPGATRRVIHLQLNQLEEQGLVAKTVFAELPPKVEYRLTAFGETLLPVIEVLGQWGETHKEQLRHVLAAVATEAAAVAD